MGEVRDRVLKGVGRIRNLPTMPENASRLMMALSDDRSDSKRIAALLMRDVAMSANVLRVANSVYYAGGAKPIADISLAVARIGLIETRNVVMAAGVIQAFSSFACQANPREFWKHAVSVALVADILRTYSNHPLLRSNEAGEVVYFGGLLHDVGLLLLGHVFPALFERLREILEEKEVPLKSVESSTLQTDHGEIGSVLVDRWNLPDSVRDSVQYHHFPDGAPEPTRPYAQLIHLSDYICNREQLGSVGIREGAHFYENAWYSLGLEVQDLPNIVERIREESSRGLAVLA